MKILELYGLLFSVYGFFALMWVFFIIYLCLTIAHFSKKCSLSNGFLYYFTMLTSPFAAFLGVAGSFDSMRFTSLIGNWGILIIIPTIMVGFCLIILSCTIYIRGHAGPIDKNLPKYSGNPRIYASRRLICVGYVGTLLYGILFILSLFDAFTYTGYFVDLWSLVCEVLSSAEGLPPLPILIIGLLGNVFTGIFIIITVGIAVIDYAMVFITAMMLFLMILPVLNGCIRCILVTGKSNAKKAVLIFLLFFFPTLSLIYGIVCLIKIKKFESRS